MTPSQKQRDYQRIYQLERYHRRRSDAVFRLGRLCFWCGSGMDIQLDHIDKSSKEIEISRLWGVATHRYEAELQKCQLLCAPCHKRKTILETYNPEHGTWGWVSRKCTCDLCRELRNKYMKEYKRRKRAHAPEDER